MSVIKNNAGSRIISRAGVLILTFIWTLPSAAQSPVDRATDLYYLGRINDAAKVYDQALRKKPNDVTLLLNAAIVERDLDRHDASYELFKRAAHLLPNSGTVVTEYAWAAMRAGKYEEAAEGFKRSLKSSMDDPQALIGLAHLNMLRRRPRQALAAAKRLVSVRPDMAIGHVIAGRAQKAQGNPKKAIQHFLAAFKADNSYSEIRLWLGPLYSKMKRYNEAWRQYAKILYVDPRHKKARAAQKRLRSRITKDPEQIIPPVRQKTILPVSAAKKDPRIPIIRVAIGTTSRGRPAPKSAVAFKSDGPFDVLDPETGKKLLSGPADKIWVVEKVNIRGQTLYELQDETKKRRARFSKVISIRPQDPDRRSLLFQRLNIAAGTVWEFTGDRQLKGTVELRALDSKGVYLINEVALEDYTYGVINEEMPERFPLEALKAQAVVARNHALQSKSYKLHHQYRYDLCDGQHCQVYSGVSGESKVGRKAVDLTRGQVLRYQGRLAHTPYSSNCGGHTQDSGEAKGWSTFPYLKGRKDDEGGKVEKKSPWQLDRWMKYPPNVYCNNPQYMHPSQFRWSRIISAAELTERIRLRTKKFGLLKSVRILKRSDSGNVNKVEFIGTRGRLVLEREQRIRGIFGVGSARNTMFTLEIERDAKGAPADIFIYGGGWGHNIGMCQIGAAGRALHGQSFETILGHYYTATTVEGLGYR